MGVGPKKDHRQVNHPRRSEVSMTCSKSGHPSSTYFYVLLTVHPNIMMVFFFLNQLDAQILYFNTFITFLYMF